MIKKLDEITSFWDIEDQPLEQDLHDLQSDKQDLSEDHDHEEYEQSNLNNVENIHMEEKLNLRKKNNEDDHEIQGDVGDNEFKNESKDFIDNS